MRIGIDIDNCISNFDDVLLEEYIKQDKKLRNTGIINEKPYYISEGMFDWSKEENDNFYTNNIQRIAMSLKPLDHAKEVIEQLKKDTRIEELKIDYKFNLEDFKVMENIEHSYFPNDNITPAEDREI